MTTHVGTQPCTWMDMRAAAAYAGVEMVDIALAVKDRELPAVTTHPRRPGVWMLRSRDLDLWALWALGRPASSAGSPAVPA